MVMSFIFLAAKTRSMSTDSAPSFLHLSTSNTVTSLKKAISVSDARINHLALKTQGLKLLLKLYWTFNSLLESPHEESLVEVLLSAMHLLTLNYKSLIW